MDKKVLGLQAFLKKAEEYEAKKLKVIQIDIENFGLVEFIRPTENVLIDYMSELTESLDLTKEKVYEGDENTNNNVLKIERSKEKMNLKATLEASEKLVYKCCPLLQAKETREKYNNCIPYEIPTKIFGSNLVLNLANQIFEKFDGNSKREEVEQEIKN